MAISFPTANRGNAGEKVSDTTITLAPTGTIIAGRIALLGVIMDNSGTTAGATTTLSVTDDSGSGDTWVRDKEQTQTAGTALDGCTIGLFRCHRTADLTTLHTITVTNTANSTAKGVGLAECQVGAGNTISVVGSDATNAAAATSYSVTVGSLSNVSHAYVAISGAEEEVGTAVTKDAAFTQNLGNGTITSGTAGVNTSNVVGLFCALIETSTTQTYDNSGLTSADRATLLVAYEETTLATPTSLIYGRPGLRRPMLVR